MTARQPAPDNPAGAPDAWPAALSTPQYIRDQAHLLFGAIERYSCPLGCGWHHDEHPGRDAVTEPMRLTLPKDWTSADLGAALSEQAKARATAARARILSAFTQHCADTHGSLEIVEIVVALRTRWAEERQRQAPAVLADLDAKKALLADLLAERHTVCDDHWYTCCAATEERDGGTCPRSDHDHIDRCTCGLTDRTARRLRILLYAHSAGDHDDPQQIPAQAPAPEATSGDYLPTTRQTWDITLPSVAGPDPDNGPDDAQADTLGTPLPPTTEKVTVRGEVDVESVQYALRQLQARLQALRQLHLHSAPAADTSTATERPSHRYVDGRLMQCKDIPDQAVITAVLITDGTRGTTPTSWRRRHDVQDTLEDALGPIPDNLMLAKLRKLIASGRIHGCPCGCRGDIHLPAPDDTCC